MISERCFTCGGIGAHANDCGRNHKPIGFDVRVEISPSVEHTGFMLAVAQCDGAQLVVGGRRIARSAYSRTGKAALAYALHALADALSDEGLISTS